VSPSGIPEQVMAACDGPHRGRGEGCGLNFARMPFHSKEGSE
jgi:hypothetical protein